MIAQNQMPRNKKKTLIDATAVIKSILSQHKKCYNEKV